MTFGLSLGLSVVLPGHAAVTASRTLPGHVPAAVSHLSSRGLVAAETNLDLAIGLPLHHREALTNLLQQINDPASTNYHRYLSAEQFAAQFGPTEQDYQAVAKFAVANGLSIVGTHPNRMLLDVRGKASNIQKAFQVTLRTYQHPTENRAFFAPDTEPSVPADLPVQDISGLDNYRQPHSHYKFNTVTSSAKSSGPPVKTSPKATTGSGPSGTYMGDDFRNAYVPGSPLKGSGQVVALVQFDGYLSNDITAYETMAGRTNIPLQNVLLDGFNGQPTGSGGEVEVSLDIEMLVSMAPALAKIMVYEGNPYNFHPNDVLNQIAVDNAAHQVSCSWGWTGGPSATTDQILQQMALQGQTFFDAAGDGDAYLPGGVDSPNGFGTPADSPYVTSVGGTTLTMTGAGAIYASETVWNWDVRYGPGADGIGSSGGTSSYYAIPYWQTNVNMTARGGSTTYRNFPDVALTADDVFVIADGGVQYNGVGGTSCAAPLWAGFLSLVNQQAVINGHPVVGFLNPQIYNIANGANYTNCFHDTVTGNNTWSGSPTQYYATNNYDLCTGLGSPNGTNLINALTSAGVTNPLTHLSAPLPPYGTTLSGLNGANPNGTWELFVQDSMALNSGGITNGWILNITTASVIGSFADLALTMTPATGFVSVGSNVVYIITVTNYGPSISSNVLVSETLPSSGAAYVTNSVTTGSAYRDGTSLLWTIGTLNTNAGARLTLTLQATASGNIFNYVVVSSTTSDPNPSDDYASSSFTAGAFTPPQITGNTLGANGQFQLAVSGSSSTIIQASTNLVNWVNVFTGTPPFIYTNFDTTNYPQRFYRAQAQ